MDYTESLQMLEGETETSESDAYDSEKAATSNVGAISHSLENNLRSLETPDAALWSSETTDQMPDERNDDNAGSITSVKIFRCSLGTCDVQSVLRGNADLEPPSPNLHLPSFSPECFQIYDWPWFSPTDCTYLYPSHCSFRDKAERGRLPKDGSDDWLAFNGDPNAYEGRYLGQSPSAAVACAIARVFVNRARHAKKKRLSFQGFEQAEMIFSSEQGKKVTMSLTKDPSRKKAIEATKLHDELRIDVWHALRGRLCEEIWGEVHPDGVVRRAKKRKMQEMMGEKEIS
ncbi:hypothetical protein K431DRAFT_345132 [Polychaeton citri CBS 116435]|uniref:Uncharacterized protein n=1 Tax=Polychaeton citri CBS 116435 TaxID=1314669 RepID=A0A9P4QBJ5_9PEZI|nr:hypothetical protein K431DRAFT_345132 [Polychaeton citri CBS 116435]